VDGRVGETFSGIRVVRAFGREIRELAHYMRGRHTILRKELFAHRRELVLWTSWGLLVSGVSVVIVWYGGYLSVHGRATIGQIMSFQWYTFLLLNPVWSIVSSFSELQRSLAAMERVFDILAMPADKPDRPGRAAGARGRRGHRVRGRRVRVPHGSPRGPQLQRPRPRRFRGGARGPQRRRQDDR
jgi:ATP-binding cassette subfamily B protein/subfamily B ATP-binding cassette protein MsbA